MVTLDNISIDAEDSKEKSLDQGIKESLDEENYGIFFVTLKPEYAFELKGHRIIAEKLGGRYWTEERMISGTYRNMHQLADESFNLEIFSGLKAIIPYEAIDFYEILRDLPF